jgi:N-acetylneuraminic acid mutarotase
MVTKPFDKTNKSFNLSTLKINNKTMKNQFAILAILLCLTFSNAQTWSLGSNIPEAIRAGNTAAYSKNGDGYLFVASGRNQDGIVTTRHQKYQLSSNTWTDLAPTPVAILGASTAIVKDTMYVIGGLANGGGGTRKVRKYSIDENIWTDAANFPANIVDTDAVAYQDSLIYVVAGYSNRARVFNTITNTWRNATSLTPTFESISWGALTVSGNKLIYMCGAAGFQSPVYYNTVRIGTIDQTNRANITWTEATPFPGETRTFFDANPWGNGIIMTGGSTDNTFETNSNECYYYDVATDVWTQLPSKPTSWLTGNSGSIQIGNTWKLICASGYGSPGYLYQTEIYTDDDVLGIDKNFETKNQLLKVEPNPTKGILNIHIQKKIKAVSIYDAIGKKLNTSLASENSVDVSNLVNGIYNVKILDNEGKIYVAKFIKN